MQTELRMGQLRSSETDETVSQHDQDARTWAFGCPPPSCLTIQPCRDGQTPPPPLPELAVSSSCLVSTALVRREMGTAEDEILGYPLSTSPKEEGTTEDEMVGWHHQLDGREFE